RRPGESGQVLRERREVVARAGIVGRRPSEALWFRLFCFDPARSWRAVGGGRSPRTHVQASFASRRVSQCIRTAPRFNPKTSNCGFGLNSKFFSGLMEARLAGKRLRRPRTLALTRFGLGRLIANAFP